MNTPAGNYCPRRSKGMLRWTGTPVCFRQTPWVLRTQRSMITPLPEHMRQLSFVAARSIAFDKADNV